MPDFEKNNVVRFGDIKKNTPSQIASVEKIEPIVKEEVKELPSTLNDIPNNNNKIDIDRENIIKYIDKVRLKDKPEPLEQSVKIDPKPNPKPKRFRIFRNAGRVNNY